MKGRHPLGRVATLWRYPVKSLAPEPLGTARVGLAGFEGDRQTALFVDSPERPRSGNTYRGKEHNLLHTVATPERAIELAAERKVAVGARNAGPYFDAAAVSLVFDAWIADLERLTGRALEPQRFRPNLFVVAEPGFALAEADLVGATLSLGAVTLEVVEPINRCVTPSYDLETGESDPKMLRTLVQERANIMGIYCCVKAAGTVACGDTLWQER
jgi:hypothetical protein